MRLQNNAETGQAPGLTVTTGNSAAAGQDAFSTVGGAPTYNAAGAHGARSFSVTSTGAAHYVVWTYTAMGVSAGRMYVRLGVAPSATMALAQVRNVGNQVIHQTNVRADRKLTATHTTAGSAFFTMANPLNLNQWYRVEWLVTKGTTSSNGSVAWAVYDYDSSTPLESSSLNNLDTGTTDYTSTWFGKIAGTGTLTAVIDDLAVDTSLIGAVQFFGTGTGALAWSGSASGVRTPRATAAGSTTFTTAAVGATVRRGDATGSTTSTGTAAGHRNTSGNGTGTTAWAGSAAGIAPAVLPAIGAATGMTTWVGAAAGRHTPKGAGVGAYSFTSGAAGTVTRSGAAAGTTGWAGSADGLAPVVLPAVGEAGGVWTFAGAATGWTGHSGTSGGVLTWRGRARGPLRDVQVVAFHPHIRTGVFVEHQRLATLTPRTRTAVFTDHQESP